MFNIVDYPPGLGECSFCKKHTCGTKEDGTQQWLHSPIELNVGGDLTIGYQCAKMIMDGFGLTVDVVEKQVLLTPTDEQIGDYVRKGIDASIDKYKDEVRGQTQFGMVKFSIETMTRSMLKSWLTERNVPFVAQWGEERLREEALKHV